MFNICSNLSFCMFARKEPSWAGLAFCFDEFACWEEMSSGSRGKSRVSSWILKVRALLEKGLDGSDGPEDKRSVDCRLGAYSAIKSVCSCWEVSSHGCGIWPYYDIK